MTRMRPTLFFASLLVVMASAALADPPPNVSFVFHNQTTVSITSARVDVKVPGPAMNKPLHISLGSIAPGGTASGSLGEWFEKSNVNSTSLNFFINAPNEITRTTYGLTFDQWMCDNAYMPACTFVWKLTWENSAMHFYVKKQ